VSTFVFLIDSLTGERSAIDQLIFSAVNKSWLVIDASDYGIVVVEVAGVRPVLVGFVFDGALEAEKVLAAAADFVGPVAAFDSIVIEQSLWCAFFFLGDSPQTFRVVYVTRIAVFVEDSKLPWTTWAAYWLS